MKTRLNKLFLLACSIVFMQCDVGIDKTTDFVSTAEIEILMEFQQLENKHKTSIVDNSEREERVLLCLTFINSEDTSAFKNQMVGFNQSASSTMLGMKRPTDEYALKTNGIAITDNKGRMYIEAVLTKKGTSVFMEFFDTPLEGVTINFKQYLTQRGIDFTIKSNAHFLGNIKKTKDDQLICFLTIEVTNPN